MPRKFTTVLKGTGPKGDLPYIQVPFDVQAEFGTRGRVPIVGTINGTPFRNSLMAMGGGHHLIPVRKSLGAEAGVKVGDRVKVVLERDTEARTVATPPALEKALAGKAKRAAREAWDALSFSHRREYAEWIEGAKKDETRARRVATTVEKLEERAKAKAAR